MFRFACGTSGLELRIVRYDDKCFSAWCFNEDIGAWDDVNLDEAFSGTGAAQLFWLERCAQ